MVKERLGHGSIRTTEGYLHALPGAQDAALTALDAVRGNRGGASKADQAAEDQKAPHLVGGGRDGREEELAQLRGMVAKFKEILGPLGDTA